MRTPRIQLGFTLIEAMVVVSILAVMAGLAAPSFRQLLTVQKVKNSASDLLTDMQLARSEALSRVVSVTIAPKSSSWNNGWTVTAGTVVIKDKTLVPGVVSIAKVTGTDDQVVFAPSGRSTGNFQLNFTATGLSNNDHKRCIKSSSAGGIKLSKGVC